MTAALLLDVVDAVVEWEEEEEEDAGEETTTDAAPSDRAALTSSSSDPSLSEREMMPTILGGGAIGPRGGASAAAAPAEPAKDEDDDDDDDEDTAPPPKRRFASHLFLREASLLCFAAFMRFALPSAALIAAFGPFPVAAAAPGFDEEDPWTLPAPAFLPALRFDAVERLFFLLDCLSLPALWE